MAVTHWRVKRLAREFGLDAETATLVLMEAGLGVGRPDDYVLRTEVATARGALKAYRDGPVSASGDDTDGAREALEWPAMRAENVNHLEPDFVEQLHSALTAEFRGTEDAVVPEGVREPRGLLESAVRRPVVAAAKYPNVDAAGAALVHSLIHNHPFHNGNKRTALLALVVFLESRNGRYIEFDEDQLYELIVSIANHTITGLSEDERANDPTASDREVLAIYEWIRAHTSAPVLGDHRMCWGPLESLLHRHGCTIERGAGAQRRIRLGRAVVTTRARNAGYTIETREVRRIRQKLGLDENHGYDSARFYTGGDPHPDLGEVVERYRGVLERLALLDRS